MRPLLFALLLALASKASALGIEEFSLCGVGPGSAIACLAPRFAENFEATIVRAVDGEIVSIRIKALVDRAGRPVLEACVLGFRPTELACARPLRARYFGVDYREGERLPSEARKVQAAVAARRGCSAVTARLTCAGGCPPPASFATLYLVPCGD